MQADDERRIVPFPSTVRVMATIAAVVTITVAAWAQTEPANPATDPATDPAATPATNQATNPASTPAASQGANQAASQATSTENHQATPTVVVPQPPPTPEQLGDSLMAHKRYQAAIAAYQQAPRNSAAVWNKMGIAYQLMFNVEEARHCYEQSLRLEPKNAHVLNNLGTVYDSMKDYKKAVKMYHKSLKIEPRSPIVLKNLGTDLLAQHKYKEGWEAYKDALAVDPDIFVASNGPRAQNPASLEERGAMNYYMAKGCVRAGLNTRAIEYLRMALNEGFTNPKKIAADREFAGLRGIPAFEQLLAAQKNP
jgi:tetratricopeptide (TPR) repeat protein